MYEFTVNELTKNESQAMSTDDVEAQKQRKEDNSNS